MDSPTSLRVLLFIRKNDNIIVGLTKTDPMMPSTSLTTTVVPPPEWLLVTGQPGSGKTTAVKTMVDFLQSHGKTCRGFYTDEVLDPKTKARIGFDVVTVPDGKRGVLSRKAGFGLQQTTKTKKHKTGQYFVDVASFEAIALPSLAKTMTAKTSPSSLAPKKRKLNDRMGTRNSDSDKSDCNHEDDCILVLDEIGRMELHSTAFSDLVRDLLGHYSPTTTPSLATTTTTSTNRLVGAITAPIYGHRVPFCDEVASRPGVEVHKLTKKKREGVLQELLESIEDRGWVERKVQEI